MSKELIPKYQKPDFCKACPITHLTTGYVPAHNCDNTNQLIVGEAHGKTDVEQGKPFVGGSGTWLDNLLKRAKISKNVFGIVNTIGCHPPNNIYPGTDDWRWSKLDAYEAIKYCRKHHVEPVLKQKSWQKIIALGEHALKSLTYKSGIHVWRSSPLALREDGPQAKPKVLPVLDPLYLMKDSKWYDISIVDIQRDLQLAPENFKLFGQLEDLQAFQSKEFVFDLEWDYNGNITLCGFSDAYGRALVVDWHDEWKSEIRRIFEEADVLIGHNIIGADLPLFKSFGWNIKAYLEDTMLLQHLVMPDMPHSLAFCASVFTSCVHWKGRGEEEEDESSGNVRGGQQWRTWDREDAIPVKYGGYGGCQSADEAYRLYNARDNARNYEIYLPIVQQINKWNMRDMYENVSVPMAKICQRLGERGIKIDRSKLKTINETLQTEIESLEQQLPQQLKTYWEPCTRMVDAPKGTYKPRSRKCKGKKKDNTLHETVEIVFDEPGTKPCPVCNTEIESGKMAQLKKVKVPDKKKIIPWRNDRTLKEYASSLGLKEVINHKTDKPTANKDARKVWARTFAEFTIINELNSRSTLRSSFAKDSLLLQERLYFNLLVHGTSEGRLSSSGKRKGIDGNIQNQPKSIRQIYVPDEKHECFLDIDWSGAENKITAYLAQDWDRLANINSGVDEHSELASWIFKREVTATNENSYLRKIGKIVNHMLNYGGGPEKLQQDLFVAGFSYTLKEVKDFIKAWREKNARTYAWQRETVQLAQSQNYLRNVFGRTRWFKSSRFMNEAMAFLPASTMADMMLRCMIALHPQEFGAEISNMKIQVASELPEGWRIVTQVHDSLLLSGPTETHIQAARLVDGVMTQKFPELGDFSLVADISFSDESWGACKPIDIWR